MPSSSRQVFGMELRYSVSAVEWTSVRSGPMLIMFSAGLSSAKVPHSSPAWTETSWMGSPLSA